MQHTLHAVPSLLEICTATVAKQLYSHSLSPQALQRLPEQETAFRIWHRWRQLLSTATLASETGSNTGLGTSAKPHGVLGKRAAGSMAAMHGNSPWHPHNLVQLCQGFSTFWQPACLSLHLVDLSLPLQQYNHPHAWSPYNLSPSGPVSSVPSQLPASFLSQGLRQLWYCSARLVHLQLACPGLVDLDWLRYLQQPCQLSCLSLRGCYSLPGAALGMLSQHLSGLRSLDLSGLPLVGDEAGPLLAGLPQLEVLNLNDTICGDATVEALTYRLRVDAWCKQTGQACPQGAEAWPRSKLHQLHLARTCISAAIPALLLNLPHLSFLDMRGTAVRRQHLQPLESRFRLNAIQGVVLTASNALAAAALNHPGLFLCTCSSSTSTAAAGLAAEAAAAAASAVAAEAPGAGRRGRRSRSGASKHARTSDPDNRQLSRPGFFSATSGHVSVLTSGRSSGAFGGGTLPFNRSAPELQEGRVSRAIAESAVKVSQQTRLPCSACPQDACVSEEGTSGAVDVPAAEQLAKWTTEGIALLVQSAAEAEAVASWQQQQWKQQQEQQQQQQRRREELQWQQQQQGQCSSTTAMHCHMDRNACLEWHHFPGQQSVMGQGLQSQHWPAQSQAMVYESLQHRR